MCKQEAIGDETRAPERREEKERTVQKSLGLVSLQSEQIQRGLRRDGFATKEAGILPITNVKDFIVVLLQSSIIAVIWLVNSEEFLRN